ncbi:MAG TPA: sugar phosphate nucleotidyltransferase, partial [Acidimicrobiia bacterium]
MRGVWVRVDLGRRLTRSTRAQPDNEFRHLGRYARPVPPVRPVVLSGGSGTRLWPLSTPDLPKQFRALIADRSLFGLTMARLYGLPDLAPAIVVTGERHVELVQAEVESAPIDVGSILVEPVGRNTAPAVLAATMIANPDDVMLIVPSDHLIRDADRFRETVSIALEVAGGGGIVTFGIEPTRPDTGFGYIEIGERDGSAFQVARFKEKPGLDEALEMIRDGRHLWNSGMFVGRANQILAEAGKHCPQLLESLEATVPSVTGGVARLDDGFQSIEAISFDHAIMERTERARVVPMDVGWSDVGSYRSLLDVSELDESGNHIFGNVTHSGLTNSYVSAETR